jgi:hypothetical protein
VDSGGVTTKIDGICKKPDLKEVAAAGITLGTSVAKMEVREVEMA